MSQSLHVDMPMIGNRPLVSVIVPIYNTPKELLVRCLSSILEQQHAELQVLLIDDGSSSDYSDWLDRTGGVDRRVSVLHQANGGVSRARNMGITHARGDYIAFVDADDSVRRDFVSSALLLLERTQADAVFGGITIAQAGGEAQWRSGDSAIEEPVIMVGNELLSLRLTTLAASPDSGACTPLDTITNVVSALYRRESLKSVSFVDGVAHAEDRLFLTDYFSRARSVALCSLPWYVYDFSSDSATRGLSLVSAVRMLPTIVELCRIGGFAANSEVGSVDSNLREAAATSAFKYFKLASGVASATGTRSESNSLVRRMLGVDGFAKALGYANCASLKDRLFLTAARMRALGLLRIMGSLWARRTHNDLRGTEAR